jgi:hypothetical protein
MTRLTGEVAAVSAAANAPAARVIDAADGAR